METDTWIERAIIDQLTTHDRRYTHDYGGVEQTTDDLVVACATLDLVTSGDGTERPPLDDVFRVEAALEPEVESALQSLLEGGLIERVGERERLGPTLEPGDYGTTALWEPTLEGRAEGRAIRGAFSAEVETLVESHGRESDGFEAGIVSLARTYGILPSSFG